MRRRYERFNHSMPADSEIGDTATTPTLSNLPVDPPKHHRANGFKNKIGQPDNQAGITFRMRLPRLPHDHEAIINDHQNQRRRHTNARFTPMSANGQWYPDQCKSNASKRKRDLLV